MSKSTATNRSNYNLGEEDLLQFGESSVVRLVRGAAHRDRIEPVWDEQLIKLQSGLTRRDAYDEFAALVEGDGIIAYRTYCARIGVLRPEAKPTMRQIHQSGAVIMLDYSSRIWILPGLTDPVCRLISSCIEAVLSCV